MLRFLSGMFVKLQVQAKCCSRSANLNTHPSPHLVDLLEETLPEILTCGPTQPPPPHQIVPLCPPPPPWTMGTTEKPRLFICRSASPTTSPGRIRLCIKTGRFVLLLCQSAVLMAQTIKSKWPVPCSPSLKSWSVFSDIPENGHNATPPPPPLTSDSSDDRESAALDT